MRYSELLANFAQVAWSAGLILHRRCAADHFQVGDPGEIGQNFILDAICEVQVLFFLAQIIERENGDTLLRDRK